MALTLYCPNYRVETAHTVTYRSTAFAALLKDPQAYICNNCLRRSPIESLQDRVARVRHRALVARMEIGPWAR